MALELPMYGSMRLGGGALGSLRLTGGAFDPLSLFSAGQQGAWYDPSDSTTVFQDAAGTTPAAVGDPVGLIKDKSGNDNDASQSTAAARPVLRQTAGGEYYLEFDGVDDTLSFTFPALVDLTFLIAYTVQVSQGGNFRLHASGNLSRLQEGFNTVTLRADDGSSATAASSAGAAPAVHGHRVDASVPKSEYYRDNVLIKTLQPTSGGFGGVDTGGIAPAFPEEHFYGSILVGEKLSDDNMMKATQYLAQKSGVTL